MVQNWAIFMPLAAFLLAVELRHICVIGLRYWQSGEIEAIEHKVLDGGVLEGGESELSLTSCCLFCPHLAS